MKKILALAVFFASVSVFANGESTHPGANPPGGGWGCHDNPGKSDCHRPNPPTQPPVEPPAQPINNGGAGGAGYGGHSTAESAASAIANALAKNDNTSVQKLWSSLTSAQKTEVATHLQFTNDQKNQFSGAVNGTLKTGDSTASSSSSVTGGAVTVGGDTTLNWTPVQVAALPPVITSGDFKLEAAGSCGPRRLIKPFDRQLPIANWFGGWNQWRKIDTVHGEVTGYDEKPYLYRTYEDPAPFYRKVSVKVGHRLYTVASKESIGGGASSAFNNSNDGGGRGFGLSGNAAGHTASVGFLAIDCDVESYEASTRPEPVKVATPPPPPVTSDLLTIREEEVVRGRRGGLVPVLPPNFCKKEGKCKRVDGSAGKRRFLERTIDCARPASPADAKLCAERKSQLGKPPIEKEETLK